MPAFTTAGDLSTRLRRYFDRVAQRRSAQLGPPQVKLVGPGVDFSSGEQEMPFHAASIGKLFTGVVILQLIAEGKLGLDQPIDDVLGPEVLQGLFRSGTPAPTLEQLLRHESGAADYFEDDPFRRNGMVRVLRRDPNRVWTPDQLLEYTREQKRPVGGPGEKFCYSDTGFILLGRAIERATSREYHDVMTTRIIRPLSLDHTFMPRLTKPMKGDGRIAPCYQGVADLSRTAALSCGWAGGGVASTPADLVRFSRALHEGELLGDEQYRVMRDARSRVRAGIHYGAAMMELRFDGFSPLLRGWSRPVGHLGSLGTYLFADPERGTHLAMNFHSRREISRSIRAGIAVENMLRAVDGDENTGRRRFLAVLK